MPEAITKKLIQRNVVGTVTPLTESGGTLTEGTAFAMLGRMGRLSFNLRNTLEEISGGDSLHENHVKIKRGWRLSLEAIKHMAGTELEDIAMSTDYAKVTIVTPRSAGTVTRVWYGIIEEHNWDAEPGKNMDRLSIVPVDIGATANPYFGV
jgi:hypothetical protein